ISSTRPNPAIRSRCAASSGPGSTTTTPSAPGDEMRKEFVPSSVIGPGLGASTRVTSRVQRSGDGVTSATRDAAEQPGDGREDEGPSRDPGSRDDEHRDGEDPES